MNRPSVSLADLNSWLTSASIILVPLTFVTVVADPTSTVKFTLLGILASLMAAITIIRGVVNKTLSFSVATFTLPLFVITGLHLLSTFINLGANPYPSLLDRTGLYTFLFVLYTALTQSSVDSKFRRLTTTSVIVTSTILGVIALFTSLGASPMHIVNKLIGTNLPTTLSFTPAGSPLALIGILLPGLVLSALLAFTKKDQVEKISYSLFSLIIGSGLIAAFLFIRPGSDNSPILMPMGLSYQTAVDTLKSAKTIFLGVGPTGYQSLFDAVRPASLNTTDLSGVKFSVAANEPLTLFATTGLISLVAFIYLAFLLFKTESDSTLKRATKAAAVASLILMVLTPANLVSLFVFVLLLVVLSESKPKVFTDLNNVVPQYQTTFTVGFYALAVAGIAAFSFINYLSVRNFISEVTFKNSLTAATKNDALKTYNLQRQAILENPYLPRFRRAYAATNIAIASSLASQKDLTDDDKKKVSQLLQQGIREAKAAVALEPQNGSNWQNLANVYRQLIGSAQGADQWTVASYAEAIKRDPSNPYLRLDLGGVYYSLGNYEQSLRIFEAAIQLKPDYANAYYNLSHAYNKLNNLQAAYDAMRLTLQNTKSDSADYTKAKDELAALAAKLPVKDQKPTTDTTKSPTTNLTTPSPAPSPKAKVEVPAESGPNTQTKPTTPTSDINP